LEDMGQFTVAINNGLDEMGFIDKIIILPDFLEVIYADGHLSIHGFRIDSIVAKPARFVYSWGLLQVIMHRLLLHLKLGMFPVAQRI